MIVFGILDESLLTSSDVGHLGSHDVDLEHRDVRGHAGDVDDGVGNVFDVESRLDDLGPIELGYLDLCSISRHRCPCVA